MSSVCRVIDTGRRDAYDNMAIDEALWLAAADQPPTLRFYDWSYIPVLSLGYFQRSEWVARSPWAGLRYVRRLTGGGAIRHGGGLTYSLTLPLELAPPSLRLYELVHQAIGEVLRDLGIATTMGGPHAGGADDFACFERHDRYGLRRGEQKLLGSAQRRSRSAVLMHGELLIPTGVDAPPAGEVLMVEMRRLAIALGLEPVPAELPCAIAEHAARLADEKYSQPWWNDHF
jgi:lipoate-protein ligase A